MKMQKVSYDFVYTGDFKQLLKEGWRNYHTKLYWYGCMHIDKEDRRLYFEPDMCFCALEIDKGKLRGGFSNEIDVVVYMVKTRRLKIK